MTLKVGLTGGIGSGKSTVAKIFDVLGVPIYYADNKARQLMNQDGSLKEKLIDVFGQEIYSNGQLNNTTLAKKVFNNPELLDKLNSIVHPAVIKDAEEWIQQQTAPYIIKEAALFFESGSDGGMDYIIGVYAPKDLRINRIIERDHISSSEIEKRMQRQIDEDIKMKLCDFVIINDEKSMIIPQVLELHKKLTKNHI